MSFNRRSNNPFKITYDITRSYYRWLLRHWKLSLIMIFILPLITGLFMKATGAFSIYEDYGVRDVGGKIGPIWNAIWEFRGQPPGWEDSIDGFFGIRKPLEDVGLNGPLNLFFIPFEFVLVDMMVYFPAFLNGEIDILLNIDIFTALIIKMGVDLQLSIWLLAAPVAIFLGVSVFLFGMNLGGAIQFGFKLLTLNPQSWARVLLLIIIAIVIIVVLLLVADPDMFKNLLGAILHSGIT